MTDSDKLETTEDCLLMVDELVDKLARAVVDALDNCNKDVRIAELEGALREIHEHAHMHTKGPAIHDPLWDIRNMAGEFI